jgi:hypothetical protein
MSDSLSSLAKRFHLLFAGMERGHGSYSDIDWEHATEEGKFKGKAITLRTPITDELWEKHLAGKYGLGVIPIRDNGTCVFGVIDIDIYEGLDHKELAAKIAKMELPLIVCRSKSGGAHLILFSTEPIPAKRMQDRLKDIAASLGHGTAEIFPKQVTRREDRDLGSWLNAPYFDHEKTNRYAILTNGEKLSAEEFLALAQLSKQPPAWFEKALSRVPDPLPDGPPCLNHLMKMGFPPGTWNIGVFNLGVYCRKARPDDWQDHLVRLNAINFPLDKWPVADLDDIKKSLLKKSYGYQCDIQPLVQFCDRAACRRRTHGIGRTGANALPILGSLTRLLTKPPIWFLEVEGHRLELTSSELLNPLVFQERCADVGVSAPVVNRKVWTDHLRPAMDSADEIPVSEDGDADDCSASGHFLELLEMFCNGRVQAHIPDEVLNGKPFTDKGYTRFRFFALQAYLTRMGFKDFKRNTVAASLKGLGGINQQERIGGKVTRVWTIPEFSKGEHKSLVPESGQPGPGGF